MNSEPSQLPSFRQFVWLFFMQPITLHHRLKACGIDEPNATYRALWFAQDANRLVKRQYVKYSRKLLFLIMPIVTVIAASLVLDIYIYILPEYVISFERWIIGVAVGVATCAVVGVVESMVEGVALGVAFGVVVGVVGGVAFGVALGVTINVAIIGVAFGIAIGVAVSVAFGITKGTAAASMTRNVAVSIAVSMAIGVVFGMAIGVIAGSVAGGMTIGVVIGVVISLCLLISFFRLPLYPLEAIGQIFFYFKQKAFGQMTLHRVPVLYHDLSYLPHPWLASHILLNAEPDPQLVKQVIAACRIAPGQRRAGEWALAQLQAQEVVQNLQRRRFEQLVELQGEWLAGVEGAAAPLLTIRELARYLQAAHATTLPDHGWQHLQRAQQHYQALKNQLVTDHSPLADALQASLPIWDRQITQLLEKIKY